MERKLYRDLSFFEDAIIVIHGAQKSDMDPLVHASFSNKKSEREERDNERNEKMLPTGVEKNGGRGSKAKEIAIR